MPGSLDDSLLVERILSEDPDEVMPPPKVNNPLSAQQKQTLQKWIEQGAEYDTHWSFAPIKKSGRSIDQFVRASLEKHGITPAPEAGHPTWLRRVTLDLTGLPPTIEDRDAFLADRSSDAYAKVIDRLLGSVDYAERMAAIWLDNARYADSNGYQFDNERKMWPWRDWVIRAYQKNMPFDEFVTEQLAGDLLPDATQEQKIATGFNRNHGFTIEGGVIDEEYRVMYVNDRTTTAGTLFLGLTLECSRCHDHKYDPISMKEYYSLYAFFNSSAGGGVGGLRKPIAPVIDVDGGRVMVMQEKPRRSFVLKAGQFDQHGDEVQPDTPAALPAFGERPRNRLGLAQWLTDDENPLLARVTVNRLWQQLFGIGLSKTVDNLGLQGEVPSHPQLLDWLAADFRDSGWDMHHLIRQIVLSKTYRQDSKRRPELEDPDNRLLARGPSFRLPARDDPRPGAGGERAADAESRWSERATVPAARHLGGSQRPEEPRRSLQTGSRRRALPQEPLHTTGAARRCTRRWRCSTRPAATSAACCARPPIRRCRRWPCCMTRPTSRPRASWRRSRSETNQRSPPRCAGCSPANRASARWICWPSWRANGWRTTKQTRRPLRNCSRSASRQSMPKHDQTKLAAMTDICLTILNLSETITRK